MPDLPHDERVEADATSRRAAERGGDDRAAEHSGDDRAAEHRSGFELAVERDEARREAPESPAKRDVHAGLERQNPKTRSSFRR